MEKIKLNKKSLLYLGAILIIVLLVLVGLFLFIKNQKTKEDLIIESLSATKGKPAPIKKEDIQNLSAPSGEANQEKVSEDVIKSLSAPAK